MFIALVQTLLLKSFFFNKWFSFIDMTTKFNQGMYAKMKAKKNEPFSNLGKRTVCIMEKGVLVTPPTPITEPTRTASPATLMEEITPFSKRQRMADKGKEKATSHSSSVWDDFDLTLTRA